MAPEEQIGLRRRGLRPGDEDWERLGICDFITKPRIAAAITGLQPNGEAVSGEYRFNDEFAMRDGLEENAEFFTLTYETPVTVAHSVAFERVAPLLWLRAGAVGERINVLPASGWTIATAYGLINDLDRASNFCAAVTASPLVRLTYIVTNDDRRFQAVARRLPKRVEPVRLYES